MYVSQTFQLISPQIIQYEMMLYLMGWSGIGHYSEPVIFISPTDSKPFGNYFNLNNRIKQFTNDKDDDELLLSRC